MVLIKCAQTSKRLWIMSDNNGFHLNGNGSLPGIIFSHPLSDTSLEKRCGFCLLMMNALPAVRSQITTHMVRFISTLQDFGQSDRTDPHVSPRIPG